MIFFSQSERKCLYKPIKAIASVMMKWHHWILVSEIVLAQEFEANQGSHWAKSSYHSVPQIRIEKLWTKKIGKFFPYFLYISTTVL